MKLKDDILFYVGYLLLVMTDMLNTIDFIKNNDNKINAIGYAFLAVFCLIKIIKNRHTITKKEILLTSAIFVMISISYFFSRSFLIFRIFLLAVSFRYIRFSEYLKRDLIIKGIITGGLIVLPLIGIIPNNILLREDHSARYSFGFYHPNALSCYLFFLIAAGYYVAKETKNKLLENLITMILIPITLLTIQFLTDSRSVLILTIVYTIYIFNSEIINKFIKSKHISFIVKNQFLIFTIISILLIVLYAFNIPFKDTLDSLFSGRISNYVYYFEEYGINFVGNKIPYKIIHGHTMYLDSMFIKMLLNYGVIVYVILGYFYTRALKRMFEEKKYYLIFVFTLLSIAGLTDTNMILPTLNVFLLYYFFKKEKGEKKQ
jgi:hypothetical protein